MSSYSYGDYSRVVYNAYREVPDTPSATKLEFKIQLPGSNREVDFFPINLNLTIKGKELCYAEGMLIEPQNGKIYKIKRDASHIRCLYVKGDLSHVEFLFKINMHWVLGTYDSQLGGFAVPTGAGKYANITLNGDQQLIEGEYAPPSSPTHKSFSKISSHSNKSILTIVILACAILLGASGSAVIFLKLGSILSSTNFFYVGGGLLGAAFIALIVTGVIHWNRRLCARPPL